MRVSSYFHHSPGPIFLAWQAEGGAVSRCPCCWRRGRGWRQLGAGMGRPTFILVAPAGRGVLICSSPMAGKYEVAPVSHELRHIRHGSNYLLLVGSVNPVGHPGP